MDTLHLLLMAFISIVVVNNLVFTKFLGICPYLGVSGRIDMAFGMGMAVTFVVTLAGTLTWLINNFVLILYGLEITKYVCFILVIAGAVQLVDEEIVASREALGESGHVVRQIDGLLVNLQVLEHEGHVKPHRLEQENR